MFKKLLGSLLGNQKEQDNSTPAAQQGANAYERSGDIYDQEDRGVFVNAGTNTDDNYDPETHHGLHYSQSQFEAELERRVGLWKADPDNNATDTSELNNARIEIGYSIFCDWNPNSSSSQQMKFKQQYASAVMGYTTFGKVQQDETNPLFQPIHGVSLFDYGAASAKMANGVSTEDICNALGIEVPVWEEASTLWIKRMQEDGSFGVTNLFGKYFGEGDLHPKLKSLRAAPLSAAAQTNLDKLATDRYFYEELSGARQAAYAYGMDGAQWILDHFGISLGDFQSVAMHWMAKQNEEMDPQKIMHYVNYQEQKQKEYAARFAKEQGGNIADDVNF